MKAKLIKTFDQDTIFRSELQNVCENTRRIIKNISQANEQLNELSLLIKDFFNKFNRSTIPIKAPETKDPSSFESSSISILLPYGRIKFPLFFVDVFHANLDFSFEDIFSQNCKWNELIGLLYQKWNLSQKKLTKTMVLMCKVLSRYGTDGQLFRFPLSHEMIANRTRQSLSIVNLTFSSSAFNTISNSFFVVNPWKLGWEIYLIVYPFSFDKEFSNLEEFTISLEIFPQDTMYRVIQQPKFNNDKNLSSLKLIVNEIGGKIYPIHSCSLNWELSSLHPRIEKSFSEIPSFLNDTLTQIKPNIQFEFEPTNFTWFTDPFYENEKLDRPSLTSKLSKGRIMNVLNNLFESDISIENFDHFSEKVGLSTRELNEIISYLLYKRVIGFTYSFRFIGAGYEYGFIIEHSNSKTINIIKQNLLLCAFSYFYESDDLIAGRIQVPHFWLSKLHEFFSRLKIRFPELKIYFGQSFFGFSLFSPSIRLPKNYFLNNFETFLSLENDLVY